MIKHQVAKRIILRASYETLVRRADFEWFSSEKIHELVQKEFSHGYVVRILSLLAEQGFVSTSEYDSGFRILYTVSEDGIALAEGLKPVPDLIAEANSDEASKALIPASDRIVLKSDNQTAANAAISILGEIEDQLNSGSNEIGEAFGDDKEVAAKEVSLLKELVQQTKIWAQSTLEFGKKTLGWIVEKAGGAAIGDLAKRALQILFDWLAS